MNLPLPPPFAGEGEKDEKKRRPLPESLFRPGFSGNFSKNPTAALPRARCKAPKIHLPMKRTLLLLPLFALSLPQAAGADLGAQSKNQEMEQSEKILIYQILPRLYSNPNDSNVFDGTKEQNGVGKLNDLTAERLKRIADFGFTHIWYTGLLEHATQTDYSQYGIPKDHPGVVKGRAGSPYAVKDYFDIDPDLAENVPERMAEFEALVERTHEAGLKMVMDFIPNHVARQYNPDATPDGVRNLGQDDDNSLAFSPTNNFYYLPGQSLETSFDTTRRAPEPYKEFPAKVTGNDRFDPRPTRDDWYETVKLNYGVDYLNNRQTHFDPVPDTWNKMTEILNFWAGKGIDAFRCDMAEMVPAEFWAFATQKVHEKFPHIRFIAEIYNPQAYRNYISSGFDYLYDKVGLYDTLRNVVCGYSSAASITTCWQQIDDIKPHMVNFLENHDEQRVASDFFAGDARKGRPALIVSAMMGTNPFMLFAGEEIGEKGMEDEGFSGLDGRTTIYDYRSVPSLRKLSATNWQDLLTDDERSLYDYHQKVISICRKSPAIGQGGFFDLQYVNYNRDCGYNSDRQYAFLRGSDDEKFLIVANFDGENVHAGVRIPQEAFDLLNFAPGTVEATDLLTDEVHTLELKAGEPVYLDLPAYGGLVLKF